MIISRSDRGSTVFHRPPHNQERVNFKSANCDREFVVPRPFIGAFIGAALVEPGHGGAAQIPPRLQALSRVDSVLFNPKACRCAFSPMEPCVTSKGVFAAYYSRRTSSGSDNSTSPRRPPSPLPQRYAPRWTVYCLSMPMRIFFGHRAANGAENENNAVRILRISWLFSR